MTAHRTSSALPSHSLCLCRCFCLSVCLVNSCNFTLVQDTVIPQWAVLLFMFLSNLIDMPATFLMKSLHLSDALIPSRVEGLAKHPLQTHTQTGRYIYIDVRWMCEYVRCMRKPLSVSVPKQFRALHPPAKRFYDVGNVRCDRWM